MPNLVVRPEAVRDHLIAMETWIAVYEVERNRFLQDDENKNLILMDSAESLATLHSEAARTIMLAEEWESLRSPLVPTIGGRPVQDTPLDAPGAPLGGAEPHPPTSPPPVAP